MTGSAWLDSRRNLRAWWKPALLAVCLAAAFILVYSAAAANLGKCPFASPYIRTYAMANDVPEVMQRPIGLLFGDSLTERSMDSDGGWGAALYHYFSRKVRTFKHLIVVLIVHSRCCKTTDVKDGYQAQSCASIKIQCYVLLVSLHLQIGDGHSSTKDGTMVEPLYYFQCHTLEAPWVLQEAVGSCTRYLLHTQEPLHVSTSAKQLTQAPLAKPYHTATNPGPTI
jgi:hypothetical protein